MKSIEALKSRLIDNKLLVQNEDGYLATVGFEWNPAATDQEISRAEAKIHHLLPADYKQFLRSSNGATLFKDLEYGQWGFKLFGLEELLEMRSFIATWGYELKPNWLPFATCLGDCDIMLFDLNRCESNNTGYLNLRR